MILEVGRGCCGWSKMKQVRKGQCYPVTCTEAFRGCKVLHTEDTTNGVTIDTLMVIDGAHI